MNPSDPASPLLIENLSDKRQFFRKTLARLAVEAESFRKRKRDGDGDGALVPAAAKRDLSQRSNGTIDSWYGCFIYDELIDYALNFSAPWSACLFPLFPLVIVVRVTRANVTCGYRPDTRV